MARRGKAPKGNSGMLLGELMAVPMTAQSLVLAPKLTVHPDWQLPVTALLSAAAVPISVKLDAPLLIIVKPEPADSTELPWSPSIPTTIISVLEVVTGTEVTGVEAVPELAAPVTSEAMANGVVVSKLVTAKAIIIAPVDVPENVADTVAELSSPLELAWASKSPMVVMVVAPLEVAVALEVKVVGQLGPEQDTVPRLGEAPITTSSTTNRSPELFVEIVQETGLVRDVPKQVSRVFPSSVGGPVA